jgi:imidazolonepropionase-like amidohydrolase
MHEQRTRRICAGWLIDGSGGSARRNVVIEIDSGRFRLPNRPPSRDPLPPPATAAIDLSDHTILPGLMDAHLHLFMSATGDPDIRARQLSAPYHDLAPVISRHLDRLLAHGIVAVRDGGDWGGYTLRYRSASPGAASPVVIRAAGRAWRSPGRYGRLIGRPPAKGQSLRQAVETDPDPVDPVKVVNSGVNSLSVFGTQTPAQFHPDDLAAAISAAHRRGRRVMVHCNGSAPVRSAIEGGCDSIEHGFFMGEANIHRMVERGTIWVPTAVTMQAYAETLSPSDPRRVIARLNYAHQLEQIRSAKEKGVRIAVGTDAGSLGVYHGPSVAGEMEALITAGCRIEEAVQSATATNADLLDLAGWGRIQEGSPAVFIAAQGPPDRLLTAIARGRISLFFQDRFLVATKDCRHRMAEPHGRPHPAQKI